MSLIGLPVVVVGAGIAGLTVARALALRGAAVTVVEQAPAFGPVGAGIQISPNAARVLQALGLGSDLAAAALTARALVLADGPSGRVVTRMDLTAGTADSGYHFLHRAGLIGLLEAGAREAGVSICLGAVVRSVRLDGTGAHIALADGQVLTAPLILGADGLHSKVRVALGNSAPPVFAGHVAWRAVITGDDDALPQAEVHMAAGRHLVSYPLPGGRRNLVAVERRGDWVAESWSTTAAPDDLRRAFAGFSPRARGWLDRVEAPGLWGLFRHPVADHWQQATEDAGMAILGDAAHPTLPFLAQGAAMAIEDAWVLAETLASHDGLRAGLAAYQARREARCRRIVAAADRNAVIYHAAGLARMAVNAGLGVAGRIAPQAVLRRFDWLYQADVTTEG